MTGPDPDPVVDWDEFEQATDLLVADRRPVDRWASAATPARVCKGSLSR